MKKKINIDLIQSELSGSVFFPTGNHAPTLSEEDDFKNYSPPPPPPLPEVLIEAPPPVKQTPAVPRHHDTIASKEPIPGESIVETVRKTVKQIGKEAATHRCTPEEKEVLADIAYSYRKHGVRTSSNELTRIAVNYMVEDYKRNGEKSFLSDILKKLNG